MTKHTNLLADLIQWALDHGYNPFGSTTSLPVRRDALYGALNDLQDKNKSYSKSLDLAVIFLESLPSGWLAKTNGDIGALNDFYCTLPKEFREKIKRKAN